MIAGLLAGGKYPSLTMGLDVVSGSPVSTFASWEIWTAKALYWYILPAMQFAIAIIIMDTWQYFLHRAMHMNKWLYSKYYPQIIYYSSNMISNLPLPASPALRSLRIWSSI
jgi:sphinganine C4-monooxygenase